MHTELYVLYCFAASDIFVHIVRDIKKSVYTLSSIFFFFSGNSFQELTRRIVFRNLIVSFSSLYRGWNGNTPITNIGNTKMYIYIYSFETVFDIVYI